MRARVAEFAAKNDVELRLEVVGETLEAIRFDVSYGGCCGYEGADAMGRRLRRPKTYDCLDCGFSGWLDDWTRVSEDGHQFLRARIRVNRVQARWERTISEAELVERADALIDQDYEALGKAVGDHLRELEFEHTYLLEVPYVLVPTMEDGPSGIQLADRRDLGLHLLVERRKVREVSFEIQRRDGGQPGALLAAMKKQWGQPHVDANGESTWHAARRTITACCGKEIDRVAIRSP